MTQSNKGNSIRKNGVTKKKESSKFKLAKSSGGGPQRILDICLFLEKRLKTPHVPRKEVCAMARVKTTSFNVAISVMKNKKGMIEYDQDTITLTPAGRTQANAVEEQEMPMLDNDGVQAELKQTYKLNSGSFAGKLFELLLDGDTHDRAEAMTTIGCGNKPTFNVMLSNMKKNGLLEYDRQTIRLTDKCFAYGSRPVPKEN